MRALFFATGLLVLCTSACSSSPARPAPPAPGHPTSAQKEARRLGEATTMTIAIPDSVGDDGKLLELQGMVFRGPAPRPATGYPVVIFNHGSPLTAEARPRMTTTDYAPAVRWFLERGYLVVTALRRGFGTSGGKFSEGVACDAPDYTKAGRIAGHDIRAIYDYVQKMPDVDRDRVVVAGHSAGGFGTLAMLAEDGVKVRAAISFAGGKGANCVQRGLTEGIVAAAGEYGHHTQTPSLWIYASNDPLFPPPVADRMFAAYREGGAPAEYDRLPAMGSDGHALFTNAAEAEWTPAVDRFLAAQGLPSRGP